MAAGVSMVVYGLMCVIDKKMWVKIQELFFFSSKKA